MNAPGMWEWVFLAVLALIIFGPERLPTMAMKAGKMIGQLKREAAGTLDELKRAAELDELTSVSRDLRGIGSDLRGAVGDVRSSFDLSTPAPAAAAAVGVAAVGAPAGTVTDAAPFDPDTP